MCVTKYNLGTREGASGASTVRDRRYNVRFGGGFGVESVVFGSASAVVDRRYN